MIQPIQYIYRFSNHSKVWVITLVIVLGSISCSRRTLPVSSPLVSVRQIQNFIRSGTGKNLNTHHTKPDQVIRTAEGFLGTPHCMGGITRQCLDCSGLTYVSFAAHGIEFPRRSQDQARYGRIIPDHRALKRGDLVFFTQSYNSPDFITHVGIYLGNRRFIHTSTSSGVIVTPISNPWWSQRFVFGTRVF